MRDKRLLLAAIGITVLVMLTLSLVAVTPTAFAKGGHGNKISWFQNPVTATLAPGGTFSTTVTFTSTLNLTNATLRLTPSLKGTTTVSPTTFATITAGTPYTFEIGVAIPLDTHRGHFNGVLTVRTGHRAYSPPLLLRFAVQH